MLKLNFRAESPNYLSPTQTKWRVGIEWEKDFSALDGQVNFFVSCPFRTLSNAVL